MAPGGTRRPSELSPLPTQVRVDNISSDRYTVIEFFAADRLGLLYTITQALFELGLSIAVAKIGTYLDQVVDVFYVTDQAGRKVIDEVHLEQIRAAAGGRRGNGEARICPGPGDLIAMPGVRGSCRPEYDVMHSRA